MYKLVTYKIFVKKLAVESNMPRRRLSFSYLQLAIFSGCFLIFLSFQLYNKSTAFADQPSFSDFNNETGAEHLIVPNIIHFIHYNKPELNFVDYVVLKAAMRNHKPDMFYYHTDIVNFKFEGKYWDWVKKEEQLWSRIRVKYLEAPTEIFGQKLSEGWRFYHGGDIGRIRVLMQYGGIYLDNDAFVIRSLDKYRKFECVLNWDENQFLGTQIIVAHKDARFLPLWLDSYRVYRPDLWYYNAGERPTVEILYKNPQLIHRVKGNFGADTSVSMNLYENPTFNWRHLDAIHLLVNHRSYSKFSQINCLIYILLTGVFNSG